MREVRRDALLGRWTKFFLMLMAVSCGAYFFASAAVELLVPPELPVTEDDFGRGKSVKTKVALPSLKAFSPIWDRNPFKAAMPKAASPSKPKTQTLDKLPVAKIKVRLLGTMYSDVTKFSRAVILDGNKQRLVKVGDKLTGGLAIVEIRRRAVVLLRGTSRQLLLIDSTDKKIASKKGEDRKMLSRQEVKSKIQDLDSLARDIQFVPASRGKEQGLWVRHLRSGSLFSKAGLERDDVVLDIEGQSVINVNPISLFQLLDKPQVRVKLLRDGKPMQLILILTGK